MRDAYAEHGAGLWFIVRPPTSRAQMSTLVSLGAPADRALPFVALPRDMGQMNQLKADYDEVAAHWRGMFGAGDGTNDTR